MACGAGMLSLATMLTALHLFTLFVIAPLIRRIPDSDHKKLLRITYKDGSGVLRDILGVASSMGFSNTIVDTKRFEDENGVRMVQIDGKFEGKPPLHLLVPQLIELPGVEQGEHARRPRALRRCRRRLRLAQTGVEGFR